jgi:trans-2,3-dihydro-3-hydroxyanthranilate isomerase
MPFAGHPNVGTAWVLRERGKSLRFEEIAGLVEVEIAGDVATIAAPQPLSLGAEMPVELLAGCVGIAPGDIVITHHKPVSASVGNSFVVAQVTGDALTRATPDVGKFREAAKAYTAMGANRLPLYLYAPDGSRVRTRMFSPLSGTIEDPATGSAATPLVALLLSLTQDKARDYEIVQGVEMGRPSKLQCKAWHATDGIRAKVGGGCVPVLKGEISL